MYLQITGLGKEAADAWPKIASVPSLRDLNGFLRRHRHAAAVLGTLIVLGVGALDVHAALPEHHDHHGVATVCIAALAIATLMAFGWRVPRRSRPSSSRCLVRLPRVESRIATAPALVMSRAGPAGCFPIRC